MTIRILLFCFKQIFSIFKYDFETKTQKQFQSLSQAVLRAQDRVFSLPPLSCPSKSVLPEQTGHLTDGLKGHNPDGGNKCES